MDNSRTPLALPAGDPSTPQPPPAGDPTGAPAPPQPDPRGIPAGGPRPPNPDPGGNPTATPAGEGGSLAGDPDIPRLLTLSEASARTGVSRKALSRRVERGTLASVKDDQGRHVIPKAELVRVGLLTEKGGVAAPGRGDMVVWQEMYQREREDNEAASERIRELELDLTAIANAGPFRAMQLRKKLRAKLTTGLGPDWT